MLLFQTKQKIAVAEEINLNLPIKEDITKKEAPRQTIILLESQKINITIVGDHFPSSREKKAFEKEFTDLWNNGKIDEAKRLATEHKDELKGANIRITDSLTGKILFDGFFDSLLKWVQEQLTAQKKSKTKVPKGDLAKDDIKKTKEAGEKKLAKTEYDKEMSIAQENSPLKNTDFYTKSV